MTPATLSAFLPQRPTAQGAQALSLAAAALRTNAGAILEANARDMADGVRRALTPAMLDRLKLDAGRDRGHGGEPRGDRGTARPGRPIRSPASSGRTGS